MHHAFVIEAEAQQGIERARAYAAQELGLSGRSHPDITILEYGLLSVADARRVSEIAAQAPIAGSAKVVIIAASRAYHEAQNALLKLFEEPPKGTFLFLVIPSSGQLLPTLRSRVQALPVLAPQHVRLTKSDMPEVAEFLSATKEKRSAIAKKLASGRDEDERRANRDRALSIVSGIESVAYDAFRGGEEKVAPLLAELATFRNHLHDRSAPVRMILEHLALVTPRNLMK